jgi:Flp pilus assembly protein TadD
MSLEEWLQSVSEFERKEDWRGLELHCKAKLNADPSYVHALFPLGLALFKQGNFVGAMPVLGKSAREAPTPQAWFILAHARHKAGNTKLAIEAMLKAVDLESKSHEAWNDLGTLLTAANDYKAALSAFNTAHNLAPKNIQTLKNIGFLYALSNYPEGVALVRERIQAISVAEADAFTKEANNAMGKRN